MAELICEPGKIFTVNELIDYINNSLKGEDGDSAYDVAVADGFVGDETTWLASMKGDTGIQGPQGDPGDPSVDFADQSEVDAGLLTTKALNPDTFTNSSLIGGLVTDVGTHTTAISDLNSIKVSSDPAGITGAGVINNAISISQADFDNIAVPTPTTLYFIPQV